jgi:hypothetical protein
MRGLDPRLSGSGFGPLDGELVRVDGDGLRLQQAIQAAAVHQVGVDQAREGERGFDEV